MNIMYFTREKKASNGINKTRVQTRTFLQPLPTAILWITLKRLLQKKSRISYKYLLQPRGLISRTEPSSHLPKSCVPQNQHVIYTLVTQHPSNAHSLLPLLLPTKHISNILTSLSIREKVSFTFHEASSFP